MVNGADPVRQPWRNDWSRDRRWRYSESWGDADWSLEGQCLYRVRIFGSNGLTWVVKWGMKGKARLGFNSWLMAPIYVLLDTTQLFEMTMDWVDKTHYPERSRTNESTAPVCLHLNPTMFSISLFQWELLSLGFSITDHVVAQKIQTLNPVSALCWFHPSVTSSSITWDKSRRPSRMRWDLASEASPNANLLNNQIT